MDWDEVVSETINKAVEASGKPVPGAVFKKLLMDRSEEQPPEGKFSDFLKKFSALITIVPRSGSDILIVPKGRMDLLDDDGAPIKVRIDFHKAFSTIDPTIRHWYNKERDKIQSFEKGFELGETHTLIPECTEESEVGLRKEFADSLGVSKMKDALVKSLEKEVPLSAFASVVRAMGLVDKWYSFRIEKMIEKIRQWSTDNNLSWQESWVSSQANGSLFTSNDSTAHQIERAINSLSDSDLARITVPLDIVIKLLKSK